MLQRIIEWGIRVIKQGIHWVEHTIQQLTKPSAARLITATTADVVRTDAELIAENVLLRQQLVVLQRHMKRSAFTNTDRRLLVILAQLVGRWRDALLHRRSCLHIVKPDTLLDGIGSCSSSSGSGNRRHPYTNRLYPSPQLRSSSRWRVTTSSGAHSGSEVSCSNAAFALANGRSRSLYAKHDPRGRVARPGSSSYAIMLMTSGCAISYP